MRERGREKEREKNDAMVYTLMSLYVALRVIIILLNYYWSNNLIAGRKWTAVRELGLDKANETVLVRGRVHNRRGTGGCGHIMLP